MCRVLFTLPLLAAVIGCDGGRAVKGNLIDAVVVDVRTGQAVRLADPQRLARLESFFPGYANRPASNVASGWKAGHEVYFNYPTGQTVRVTVSTNENAAFWTVGNGDFRTQGDFLAFVRSLSNAR